MDVNNETTNCETIINSFLDFYGNLNRRGFVIKITENGWYFVHVSFLETNDAIISIPWPTQSQIPGIWNTSPSSPRSPSPDPSYASTEEFVPRSPSPVPSMEEIVPGHESTQQSAVQWYTLPTTPPRSSPSPSPERRIPGLLFRQAPPRLNECTGCQICLSEEVFPNIIWQCGHMICQSCVLSMEESGICVRCPTCRASGPYFVGRVN